MAWTDYKERGVSTADFFRRRYPHLELIETAVVRNVFYAAARHRDDPEGNVFALVHPIRHIKDRGYGNFWFNDYTEDDGPFFYDAPLRLLDKLTPTESEYANKWRQKCRKQAAIKPPRVEPGDIIRFHRPITFVNGDVADTFLVARHKKRARRFYRIREDGTPAPTMYDIKGWRRMAFEIVNEEDLSNEPAGGDGRSSHQRD